MLDHQVLVLNRLWQAINVCTVRRAFTLLCQGHAQVVYADGRNNFLTPGDAGYTGNYEFRRDYRNVFEDHPNNTFLIKWSYWINP